MSAPPSAPAATTSLWQSGALVPREDCDVAPSTIEAADSWLVEEGTVRGLDLHRERFLTSIPRSRARGPRRAERLRVGHLRAASTASHTRAPHPPQP